MHVTGKQIAGKKLQIMVQVYQTFLKILVNILFRILQYAYLFR